MDFHILGPLEVVRAGELIDLGRPRQRAVLAVLLISANRVMALDRLIELLWDGEAPTRATGALQAYISNLRRALEPSRPARTPAAVLVTLAPGYVLRVAPEHLDSARFESLAARGHELLTSGRPLSARASLAQALSLWRGPALAEFAGERFAHGEAARLQALRAVAAEDRFEAELQLGAHAPAVAELEAAVTENPYREHLWGLLVTALYRSGQQAEALRAYDRARRILREQLGVAPSPTLRALEADVLSQAPTLDWRPPASEEDGSRPVLALPLAAVRGDDPSDELVGRRPQLEALERALARTRAGRGRLVLLAGEAGIGKTRLAEELAVRAEAEDVTVAWGRAYEFDGAPPFWPWIQVVRRLLTTVEPAAVAALNGAGELARLVPEAKELVESRESPPALDPGSARFRLYEAVVELLLLVATRHPLVVLVDDLHWADPLSVNLLAHLGERIEGAPILVVATYRSPGGEESGAISEILGRLARLRTVVRLTVPGLSPAEVGQFMVQAGGFEPTAEQVATVHSRTEGNPFYVTELSRLLATGDLTVMDAVPAGVVDVVRRRLARLPERTRALLVVASVVGRDFDLSVVTAAAQMDLDETVDLIEAAVATGVVAEDPARPGHYRFSHALVRDTVYAQISGLRRARLHVRVGAAVAAVPDADGRTAELADHFFRAAVVDGPEPGFAYKLLAYEKARSSLAY
ncbi:MAG TPA: BTAD domain-containing putative transcriptional regulator [Acidimicrobiales bacterium]|nr:BTAD domain-containing putative transcriptional regulator [Acidimicrobiales bacterium]